MSKQSFPEDRRKLGYAELDKRVDRHTKAVEKRFRRWFINGLIAFTVIGVTSVGALIGFGFVLSREQKQNEAIQTQRRTYIREECQDVNTRHKNTRAAFLAEVEKDLKTATTEAMRADVRRRAAVTIAVIDAVLPKRNCEQLVTLATTGG